MKKLAATAVSAILAAGIMATAAYADNTITIALDSDIIALDPAFAYDFTTNPVVIQITEGLFSFDETETMVPGLAKSWEAVDDVTYVYQIRDDVTFSDGTPMTMDDVLFSIERTMSDDTGSYLQWMFASVDSVEQTGDWEMTVHLTNPDVNWKYALATTAGHIISKAYYEEHAADFGMASGGLMGTGPYVYDSWTSGQEIVLKKNENYWDTDAELEFDEIVFKIIPEDTTRVTALQTGEVDMTPLTPADMLDVLMADENLEVQDSESFGVCTLSFNTQRAPFDDANVRKAVSYAIDREAIDENIVKGAGIAGTCMPNSSVLYNIEPEKWEEYVANTDAGTYNMDKAKECLAASAYPDGFNCNMIISDNSMRYSMALVMQESLKELGIEVELVQVNGDEHTLYQTGGIEDADGKRDYDMILCGWEADFPDISGNIEPLMAGYNAGFGGFNSAVFMNDEVDELLAAQAASLDDLERNEMMFKVMDIVNEECPYAYITYPNRQATMQKGLTGFTMNPAWNNNMFVKNMHYAE